MARTKTKGNEKNLSDYIVSDVCSVSLKETGIRMKFLTQSLPFLFGLLVFSASSLYAQQIILRGIVEEGESADPMAGVNIFIEGTTLGTATNQNGTFDFVTDTPPPFTLIFSFVGFTPFNQVVTGSMESIHVKLYEHTILGDEVVISSSMIEESIMQSSATIEKLEAATIKRMPSANFYDGLSSLKGVDLTVHSLTFKVPNARGFNSNTSVRINQFVDGMDNAAPGLSFAAGNIFGVNQLDLESVEFLLGASSALYGPGSMNGTLLMTSKNPFQYQGLSASVQWGIMNINSAGAPNPTSMGDINFRYAKAVNERLAFKISAGYLGGQDWHAANYRDRTDLTNSTLTRSTNPGYDGINTYGDDIIVPVNLKQVAPDVVDGIAQQTGVEKGTPEYLNLYNQVISLMPDQVVSRTGYDEKDLVDYSTKNLRISSALHYLFRKNLEGIFQVGYSDGTSVYTTSNRFSLKNFNIFSGKLELKGDNFHVRTYGVFENSGESYDAGVTGLVINEAWKTSEAWYEDYIGSFAQNRLLGSSESSAHDFARLVADNRDRYGNRFALGKPTRPLPGTPEFDSLFHAITSRSVSEGGSKVIDRSKLWHSEFLYNFAHKIKFMEIIIGGSYRFYSIDSQGTIFIDSPGNPILINQFGGVIQVSKKMFHNKGKLTAAARYDKNDFFKGRVTPRFSFVYALNKQSNRNLRASFQTAFRFPTVADQWVNLNTGRYQVVGGQSRVQDLHRFATNPVYPLSGTNPITDTPITKEGPFRIPAFEPEEVQTMELGYRGMYLSGMILVDGYVYRNKYNHFLASQTLAQNPGTDQEKRYETTISTDFPILTYGWALGVDVKTIKGFILRGNINYNTFSTTGNTPPGFKANFNTPAFRYNVALYNRDIIKNMDVSVNWRWQQQYLWESSFGVAELPAFATLDAAIGLKLPRMNASLKVGGSNLLNHYYTTNLGSAQIGGLYYITWILDSL